MDASLRLIARHLEGLGYDIFLPGATDVFGVAAAKERTPDICAVHRRQDRTVLVFYVRNCQSQIDPENKSVRAVYCEGAEDFIVLWQTGRPLVKPTQNALF